MKHLRSIVVGILILGIFLEYSTDLLSQEYRPVMLYNNLQVQTIFTEILRDTGEFNEYDPGQVITEMRFILQSFLKGYSCHNISADLEKCYSVDKERRRVFNVISGSVLSNNEGTQLKTQGEYLTFIDVKIDYGSLIGKRYRIFANYKEHQKISAKDTSIWMEPLTNDLDQENVHQLKAFTGLLRKSFPLLGEQKIADLSELMTERINRDQFNPFIKFLRSNGNILFKRDVIFDNSFDILEIISLFKIVLELKKDIDIESIDLEELKEFYKKYRIAKDRIKPDYENIGIKYSRKTNDLRKIADMYYLKKQYEFDIFELINTKRSIWKSSDRGKEYKFVFRLYPGETVKVYYSREREEESYLGTAGFDDYRRDGRYAPYFMGCNVMNFTGKVHEFCLWYQKGYTDTGAVSQGDEDLLEYHSSTGWEVDFDTGDLYKELTGGLDAAIVLPGRRDIIYSLDKRIWRGWSQRDFDRYFDLTGSNENIELIKKALKDLTEKIKNFKQDEIRDINPDEVAEYVNNYLLFYMSAKCVFNKGMDKHDVSAILKKSSKKYVVHNSVFTGFYKQDLLNVLDDFSGGRFSPADPSAIRILAAFYREMFHDNKYGKLRSVENVLYKNGSGRVFLRSSFEYISEGSDLWHDITNTFFMFWEKNIKGKGVSSLKNFDNRKEPDLENKKDAGFYWLARIMEKFPVYAEFSKTERDLTTDILIDISSFFKGSVYGGEGNNEDIHYSGITKLFRVKKLVSIDKRQTNKKVEGCQEVTLSTVVYDNKTDQDLCIDLEAYTNGKVEKEQIRSIVRAVSDDNKDLINDLMECFPFKVDLYVLRTYFKDLLGFYSNDIYDEHLDTEGMIALHSTIVDSPVALFHEICEYMINETLMGLDLSGDSLKVSLQQNIYSFDVKDQLYDMKKDIERWDINWRDDPHYLLRVFQRYLFGKKDVLLSSRINKLNSSYNIAAGGLEREIPFLNRKGFTFVKAFNMHKRVFVVRKHNWHIGPHDMQYGVRDYCLYEIGPEGKELFAGGITFCIMPFDKSTAHTSDIYNYSVLSRELRSWPFYVKEKNNGLGQSLLVLALGDMNISDDVTDYVYPEPNHSVRKMLNKIFPKMRGQTQFKLKESSSLKIFQEEIQEITPIIKKRSNARDKKISESKTNSILTNLINVTDTFIEKFSLEDKCPFINIEIDISMFDSSDDSMFREELQTLVCLMLQYAKYDKVNFVFMKPHLRKDMSSEFKDKIISAPTVTEYRTILNEMIRRELYSRGQGDLIEGFIKKRIDQRRDDAWTIKVSSDKWFKWIKDEGVISDHIGRLDYPVCMSLNDRGINSRSIYDFRAAFVVGMAKVVLAVAKEKFKKDDLKSYEELKSDIVNRLNELYNELGDFEKLSQHSIDNMISDNINARVTMALIFAIPPAGQFLSEEIMKVHRTWRIFINNA